MSVTESISSPQNASLKLVGKLGQRRARSNERAFVVEGEDLLHAAITSGAKLRKVLVDADHGALIGELGLDQHVCALVDSDLMATVSQLGHAARVIAIVEHPAQADIDEIAADTSRPIVLCDAIQDPGNLGTILRSAAAFGASAVMTTVGSADPWSPKAVRASMGACFSLPIIPISADELRDLGQIRTIVGLDGDSDMPLWSNEWRGDGTVAPVLCVGNERRGVSSSMRGIVTQSVQIPHNEAIDSLNAGIAISLALYEWNRGK